MKDIYVDASSKFNRIGVVVVEDGLVKKCISKKIKVDFRCPAILEVRAMVEGMKYLTEGGTIHTDQTDLINSLLEYGCFRTSYSENVIKNTKIIRRKLLHKLNTLMYLKKNVTFCDIKSHGGNKFHNLADKLSTGKIPQLSNGYYDKMLTSETEMVIYNKDTRFNLI